MHCCDGFQILHHKEILPLMKLIGCYQTSIAIATIIMASRAVAMAVDVVATRAVATMELIKGMTVWAMPVGATTTIHPFSTIMEDSMEVDTTMAKAKEEAMAKKAKEDTMVEAKEAVTRAAKEERKVVAVVTRAAVAKKERKVVAVTKEERKVVVVTRVAVTTEVGVVDSDGDSRGVKRRREGEKMLRSSL
jgi:hypothetical protein